MTDASTIARPRSLAADRRPAAADKPRRAATLAPRRAEPARDRHAELVPFRSGASAERVHRWPRRAEQEAEQRAGRKAAPSAGAPQGQGQSRTRLSISRRRPRTRDAAAAKSDAPGRNPRPSQAGRRPPTPLAVQGGNVEPPRSRPR